MILIAGIQPRTRKGPKIDTTCPRCGLAQVHERRLDHYASLFFIPLLRVKKGVPFMWCDRCEAPLSTPEEEPWPPGEPTSGDRPCPGCAATIDAGFRFCPYCGQPLD